MNRAAAIALGVLLFSLPFLQSGLWSDHAHEGSDHMDHSPHHGGSLLMLGDHHIEVVDEGKQLELYLSDSERRPIQPRLAFVRFDDGGALSMEWSAYRLVIPRPDNYQWADYRIVVDDGPPLTIRLPASGVSMPPAD